MTVDNPMRDLPGIVLVAATLCARGHRALLVPVNVLSDAWAANPDFFLLGYHRSNNDYQVKRILGRGRGFAVLDTEGAPYNMALYEGILTKDANLRGRTSAVCVWGGKLADAVAEKGFYSRSQLRVTGAPRMDFYHPSLAESARRRSREALRGPERFILVLGSAAVANPRFRSPEAELREFIRLSGLDADWCRALQSEQAFMMEQMIETAGRLAGDFPGTPVVLRPHPFENPAPYADLLAGHGNMRMVQGGTVDGLLLRACCVVQRSSTTSIEAAAAGVPALSMHWIPMKCNYSEDAEAVIHPCADYATLREKASEALDGSYRAPGEIAGRAAAVVAARFYRNDGRSHERVADVVEGAASEGGAGRRCTAGLAAWAVAAKAARKDEIRSWEKSVKYFDEKSVAAILASFQDLDLPDLAHLKTPLRVSRHGTLLGGFEPLRSRAVEMSPASAD